MDVFILKPYFIHLLLSRRIHKRRQTKLLIMLAWHIIRASRRTEGRKKEGNEGQKEGRRKGGKEKVEGKE